jgi:hypothetical protein
LRKVWLSFYRVTDFAVNHPLPFEETERSIYQPKLRAQGLFSTFLTPELTQIKGDQKRKGRAGGRNR